MEEISANDTIHYLLKCLTELNVADAEEASVEGFLSGRVSAQVLIQLLKAELDDNDDIWKIANAESDDEISKNNYEQNWRIIMDRIPRLFSKNFYELNSHDLWKFDITELLNRNDNAIIRALVIFCSSAVASETQVRTKILDLLESFPISIKEDLKLKLRDFFSLITVSNNSGNTDSNTLGEIRHLKVKLAELTQARDKLKKENDALSADKKDFFEQLELYKKEAEEAVKLKNQLMDADLKIKYLEGSLETIKKDNADVHTAAQSNEYKLDEMDRQLKDKDDKLDKLKAEFRIIQDECETIRCREGKLRLSMREQAERIRIIEREASKAKDLEHQLNVSHQKIDNYVKQLADADSLKTKVNSMEQLLLNSVAQTKKLSEELSIAISRSNNAEAELSQLKDQYSREMLARSTETSGEENSFTTPSLSLHDELNNMSFYNNEDYNRVVHEVAEWKSKYETLVSENSRLLTESTGNEEVHKSAIFNYDTMLEKERVRAEKAELERENIAKRISGLEQSLIEYTKLNETLKAENAKLAEMVTKYEDGLGKAADMIRFYSEGENSAAENLKLRNELTKLQRELELLRMKNEQHKHESCQEQRLITSHLYQKLASDAAVRLISESPLAGAAVTGGGPITDGGSGSAANSQRSFIARQLATSDFTASSSSASRRKYFSLWKILLWLCALLFVVLSFRYNYCNCCTSGPCTYFGNLPPFRAEYVKVEEPLIKES